jgi:hypothetical protein
MDDIGRAPGRIKLYLDGGIPKALGFAGFVEKSSISSLKIMPVEGDIIPKYDI